jgi:hypothetical protein
MIACLLALSCSPAPDLPPNVPESLQTPWQLRPEGDRPLLHRHTDGFAVSPSGRFVVAAISARPGNEVATIDLGTKIGHILRADDDRVLLAQPAVNVDEDRIALVATPLGHFGISEIWLVDPISGSTSVISAPGASFQFPAFSPDGSELAYFRNVNASKWRPGLMRPEYRTFLSYALFRRNLATGVETRVAEQAFELPCGLSYDTLNRGLFYCALAPLQKRNLGGARSVWMPPSGSANYASGLNGSGNFFVRWSERIPQFPRPYAPLDNPLTDNARLAGALSEGRVLLRNFFETERAGVTRGVAAVVFDGSSASVSFAPGLSGDAEVRSSLDGRIIAALDVGDVNDPNSATIAFRDPAQEHRFALTMIDFDEEVQIQPVGSEF